MATVSPRVADGFAKCRAAPHYPRAWTGHGKTGAGMGARLAESVDAADLKFASLKGVPVRVRQRAPQFRCLGLES